MKNYQTVSPIDGAVVAEGAFAEDAEIRSKMAKARQAQTRWKQTPIRERVSICRAFRDRMLARKEVLGREITLQMGRPIQYSPREIIGMADRTEYMGGIAEATLADIAIPEVAGFKRYIRREPLGVVFAIIPWNYPYLTAVNCGVPALLAGNAVVLKPSPQTPLCADRMAEAFAEAGLPDGVFQVLHLDAEATERVVRSTDIDFVSFTGSVTVGRAVQSAASGSFIGVGLELGGKDPAYVRADADLAHSVENLVDGAFFNSGQSCCAIERIYVHSDLYEGFVEGAVEATNHYRLGNPLDPEVDLGPMVRTSAADLVRSQIEAAIESGAKAIIDESTFPASRPGSPYLAPQILVGVDHSMSVMRDESFGPVVGIMRVESDDEAIGLMNDSPFGLTASVWTRDIEASERIGERVETGTLFMNRCDYLDPALAWTGVKDSGHGCSLSQIGFEQLTRPKSFHLRK